MQGHSGSAAARGATRRWSSGRCAYFALVASLSAACGQSSAGHSVGHFPSYYPDEIRIEVLDPNDAAKGLIGKSLHAYIGANPSFTEPLPAHVRAVNSLGSFLVLSLKTELPRFASREARCAAVHDFLAVMRKQETAPFVFHPYPVTPFHTDYLHHLDLVQASRGAVAKHSSPETSVKISVKGPVPDAVVPQDLQAPIGSAEALLESIPVKTLVGYDDVLVTNWPGPPWIHEGWFQAHRLLAPHPDPAIRDLADQSFERLIRGEYLGLAERANIERALVSDLTGACKRQVVGYSIDREYLNEANPEGIENVAFDSINGLNSPVFVRTAKLKDYPWNGKLHIGVSKAAKAAWNPVTGFTDPVGRLMWSAIGDPAMISFPFNGSWMANRVQSEVTRVEGQSGGIRVPGDAPLPQAGTGKLHPVGARTFGSVRIVYEVLASPFDDGTEMDVADLLYANMFPIAGEHGRHRQQLRAAAEAGLGHPK